MAFSAAHLLPLSALLLPAPPVERHGSLLSPSDPYTASREASDCSVPVPALPLFLGENEPGFESPGGGRSSEPRRLRTIPAPSAAVSCSHIPARAPSRCRPGPGVPKPAAIPGRAGQEPPPPALPRAGPPPSPHRGRHFAGGCASRPGRLLNPVLKQSPNSDDRLSKVWC